MNLTSIFYLKIVALCLCISLSSGFITTTHNTYHLFNCASTGRGRSYTYEKNQLTTLFSSIPGMDNADWYDMDQCSVIIPNEKVPKAIIHFIGGFVAGSTVSIAYSSMLSLVAKNGYLVVATPIPPIELNHEKVADDAFQSFANCYKNSILPLLGSVGKDVPIIGLSHSLGGKLTVLMGADVRKRKVLPKRAGNVFLAFNNYGMKDSIDASTQQARKASPELSKIMEVVNTPAIQKLVQEAADLTNNEFFKNINSNLKTEETSKKSPGDVMGDMMGAASAATGLDVSNAAADVSAAAQDFLNAFDQMRSSMNTGVDNVNLNGDKATTVGKTAAGNTVRGMIEGLDKYGFQGNTKGSSNEDMFDSSTETTPGSDTSGSTNGFSDMLGNMEFNPSPEATWQLLLSGYNIPRNCLIRFADDEIDQSKEVGSWMLRRGCKVELVTVPGNHVTPNIIIPPNLLEPFQQQQQRQRASDSDSSNSSSSGGGGGGGDWQDSSGDILEDFEFVTRDDEENAGPAGNPGSSPQQQQLEQQQRTGAKFMQKLLLQLNALSNEAWDDVIAYSSSRESFQLPAQSGYGTTVGTDSGSSGGTGSSSVAGSTWDSDEY